MVAVALSLPGEGRRKAIGRAGRAERRAFVVWGTLGDRVEALQPTAGVAAAEKRATGEEVLCARWIALAEIPIEGAALLGLPATPLPRILPGLPGFGQGGAGHGG